MSRYRYAIYFEWNDGFKDTCNAVDASDRNSIIKDMIDRKRIQLYRMV